MRRPVPLYVDLHPPGGLGCGGGDLLEGAGGERGQDQQGSDRGGAAGRGDLTLGVGQALDSGGSDGDRRADRAAEQGRGGGDLGDPGQDAGVELPAAPGLDVATQEALVVGAARIVGVRHLTDGVPRLVLDSSRERSVTRGGRGSGTSGLCSGAAALAG